MCSSSKLKKRCKVTIQAGEDYFVGLKIGKDNAFVYFPLGYKLPKNDNEIRKDILNLFYIIKEFSNNENYGISKNVYKIEETSEFPITSYLEVIKYYMENGYYVEKDYFYASNGTGKIQWSKTIKKQKPLIQKNEMNNQFSPIYTTFISRQSSPNEDKIITDINKYCVYESFKKLGWLFTDYMPKKPIIKFNKSEFLLILNKKLNNMNNDKNKLLFKSMIDLINFNIPSDSMKEIYFGTEKFEYIWEKLIDKAFGIKNKEVYFPRAHWNLKYGKEKSMYPLQPDSIMILDDKIYVIDAKYYKYGETKNPLDLPNSASINKQITYGEYIQKSEKFQENNIFNAFLMPFNKNNDLFEVNKDFLNIGEAIGEWRENKFNYEHVQGILVDVRFLFYCYTRNSKNNLIELANSIESTFNKI